MRKIALIIFALIVTMSSLSAQNIFGVTGGFGSGGASFTPVLETRSTYGLSSYGVSWRNYSYQKAVGCFGIDLEYMERAFSYAPFASQVPEGEKLYYYTRKINTLMMPIVWQPHLYLLDRRIRVFMEAAATFSYDLNSTYSNDWHRNRYEGAGLDPGEWEGDYDYMTSRDNRLGYGLAGGGGISLLFSRIEVMARARYYYGLSDVVRNRNKYYSNNLDGPENPFTLSPTRSPLSSFFICFGVSYHFGAEGFKSWDRERIKTPKMNDGFKFNGQQNSF